MTVHKFFPLGLRCAHCDRWHDLPYSITHSQLVHPDCVSCKSEAMLSQAILDEAADALATVAERFEAPA
jgi:hypothetical protein